MKKFFHEIFCRAFFTRAEDILSLYPHFNRIKPLTRDKLGKKSVF